MVLAFLACDRHSNILLLGRDIGKTVYAKSHFTHYPLGEFNEILY